MCTWLAEAAVSVMLVDTDAVLAGGRGTLVKVVLAESTAVARATLALELCRCQVGGTTHSLVLTRARLTRVRCVFTHLSREPCQSQSNLHINQNNNRSADWVPTKSRGITSNRDWLLGERALFWFYEGTVTNHKVMYFSYI